MTLFPDWQDAHKDDPPLLPERIRVMHGVHGFTAGQVCKNCKFMARVRYAKVYIKCTQSHMTHGPGTDWRANWPACGLFEQGEPKTIQMTT